MNPGVSRLASAIAASAVLAGGQAAAQVPDAARGRLLYENHCVVCHTQKVHRRNPPMPIDLSELRRIVSTWAKEENLPWTREEVEDVVHYLDRSHYQLSR